MQAYPLGSLLVGIKGYIPMPADKDITLVL